MKTIIAGSRSIVDQSLIDRILDKFFVCPKIPITEVVSGKALGVDTLGEDWAIRNGIPVIPFPADWKNIDVPGAVIKYNKYGAFNAVAGHMRNEQMAKYAEALILFWDGVSTGSSDMFVRAVKHKLVITRFVIKNDDIQYQTFDLESNVIVTRHI